MFNPTLRIELWGKVGNDLYGQPAFAKRGEFKVAPVKLIFTNQHTTVRTDSAGSHGHAQETTADVVLLVPASNTVALDDMLVVLGHRLRVVRIHPRYRVSGQHDHDEVHCDAWV
jgi:hypothetical protein